MLYAHYAYCTLIQHENIHSVQRYLPKPLDLSGIFAHLCTHDPSHRTSLLLLLYSLLYILYVPILSHNAMQLDLLALIWKYWNHFPNHHRRRDKISNSVYQVFSPLSSDNILCTGKYSILPIVHKHQSVRNIISLTANEHLALWRRAFSSNCHKSSCPGTEESKWWLWCVTQPQIIVEIIGGRVDTYNQISRYMHS